ncbi:hypothetical protein RRG08_066257 [Elysia crispata]|uniref:Uncharacterized protein n=1 Tax=Elysia crispata TaxID=231223 RepID=A0AAE1BF79_9GAST|nr:hypothetical protein RRG08_066257 [Elysia crispata]
MPRLGPESETYTSNLLPTAAVSESFIITVETSQPREMLFDWSPTGVSTVHACRVADLSPHTRPGSFPAAAAAADLYLFTYEVVVREKRGNKNWLNMKGKQRCSPIT